MGRAIYKVPDGKLVKISLSIEESRVKDIKIFGDFFAYPEGRIEELEAFLTHTEVTEEALREKMEDFFKQNKTELFGVDIAALVHATLMAL